MTTHRTDTLVIGAGIVGIATAYYLKKVSPDHAVTIIDQGQPMAFTSAKSGENYRNWWPHPTMKAFTDHSIDLMEDIALESNDQINLTKRGYLLTTRNSEISELIDDLQNSYSDEGPTSVRFHTDTGSYLFPESESWRKKPNGVDILQGPELIQELYPSLDKEVQNVIHIRRGGTVSSQQLGQFMLDRFRAAGGKRLTGLVTGIDKTESFSIKLADEQVTIEATNLVNAAGPFANQICEMLGTSLPVQNILHQKIAFPDHAGAIPRKLPFTIDLDSQYIDWEEDEKQLLAEDEELAWLAEQMPGAIHCRPEGGDNGSWIKLGWAFNKEASTPTFEPEFNDNFPEIVLRGAARLHPALKTYYGHLPRSMTLYGGYYTMTDENWPLIGPTDINGFYVNAAMSGFGTMAACAGGELCAQWVLGEDKPDYANNLSLARYQNGELIDLLQRQNTGIL